MQAGVFTPADGRIVIAGRMDPHAAHSTANDVRRRNAEERRKSVVLLSRGRMAVALAILAVAATDCKAPGQYGGPIPVDNGGLSGRLVFLCRAGISAQTHGGCPDDVADSGIADEAGPMDLDEIDSEGAEDALASTETN